MGAAILCSDGRIVTGCNIESSVFGLTICAERCAVFNALSQGYSFGDLKSLAIVTGGENPTPPCGACRQVIWDWAPEIEIISATLDGKKVKYNIKELFPNPFDKRFF